MGRCRGVGVEIAGIDSPRREVLVLLLSLGAKTSVLPSSPLVDAISGTLGAGGKLREGVGT